MNQCFQRGAVDLDHFVKTVDGRIGWHAAEAAAQRNDLHSGDVICAEVKLVADHLSSVFWQRMLAEQGGGDVGRAEAGAVSQILPRQIFFALASRTQVVRAGLLSL